MLFTIFVFIIVLSVIVFVHEFGHFWVAKKFGLIPEEFGFGFPPRIFGIYKDKNGNWQKVKGGREVKNAAGTVYSFNWIPLGGFVKLGEDEEAGDNPNHFNNKPVYQRASILLAGVTMNIILAMVLISWGFMIGLPAALDNVGSGATISNPEVQIVEVLPDSPAAVAGLKVGDVIESINNHNFIKTEEVQNFVAPRSGQSLDYKIKRGGDEFDKQITPKKLEKTNKAGVGIAIVSTGLVRYSFFTAIWQGIKTTVMLFWAIILAFYGLLKGLVLGQGVSAGLAGPIGIAALTGRVARMGFVYILQFTAILSINLALINALPFPALDGGRVLFLIIEKIKGRPMRKELEGAIHNIGFAFLIVLMILVTFRDVVRFSSSFKALWGRFF